MKLYYSPGACSLASHIALKEAGLSFEAIKVDGRAKKAANGEDYWQVTAKGYVPALRLDDGSVLTENAVLLQYLAFQAPKAELAPSEGPQRWRLLETLNFIATELHKSFSPLFRKPAPEAREAAIKLILNRLTLLQGKLGDKPYLLGDRFTIADAYAYVILNWARSFSIDLSDLPKLTAYFERMRARPAVQQALREEGLPTS